MKVLAISDMYIPPEIMKAGLKCVEEMGVEVCVRYWKHESLIDLQKANLAIEKGGPEAVVLPEEIREGVKDFDIAVVQFAPIDRRFIEAASQLKVIGVLRNGAENVAVEAATGRGIAILNTPGRNARAVAECTVGMILAEIRNIARAHANLAAGRWRRSYDNSEEIPELEGRTAGLVGYGAVGRLAAGFLRAFGCRIIAFDPYCEDADVELVGLEELLGRADIVSIHARLTEESRHLIGEKELALMKRTAILVNTARSGLVDEKALVRALREKRIMGAALDVFDTEPLPEGHEMLKLSNATLTPHLAGSTIDAFRKSAGMMGETLCAMLKGEKKLPVVNAVQPTLSKK